MTDERRDTQPETAAEARRRGIVAHCDDECWSHHCPTRCPQDRRTQSERERLASIVLSVVPGLPSHKRDDLVAALLAPTGPAHLQRDGAGAGR